MSEGKSGMEQQQQEQEEKRSDSPNGHRESQDSSEKPDGSSDDLSINSSSSSSQSDQMHLESKNAESGTVPLKKKEKKPKSEASVVHDKAKGVCRCKRCGWAYPNPRPSAKQRREHRKHCGKIQSVHAWLDNEDGEDHEVYHQGMEVQSEEDDSSSSNSAQEAKLSQEHVQTSEAQDMKVIEAEVEPNNEDKVQSMDEQEAKAEADHDPGNEEVQTKVEVELDHEAEVEQSSREVQKSMDEQEVQDMKVDKAVEVEAEPDNEEFQDKARSLDEQDGSKIHLNGHVGDKLEQETVVFRHEHHPTHSEKEFTSDSSEITAVNDPGTSSEYDLEKILKEQTSHHLMCPNCGSCITRRVILKKRKRTAGITVQPLEKQAKTEIKDDVHVEVEEAEAEREIEPAAGEEAEAWGCLACFAIFFRKVCEKLDEPVDSAHHFSCLPYLLPDFRWDGDGLQTTQEEEEPRSSSCLPIEFPWTKAAASTLEEQPRTDVEIIISLPEQPAPAPAADEAPRELEIHDEQKQEKDHFSCLPLMLPTYWRPDEPAAAVVLEEPESAEVNENKAGFNCLPALTYTWRKPKSYEPVPEPEVVEQMDQESTTVDSSKAESKDEKVELIQESPTFSSDVNIVDTSRNLTVILPKLHDLKDEAPTIPSQEAEQKDEILNIDIKDEQLKDDGSLRIIETERDYTLILPKAEEEQRVPESAADESCNCLPVSIPKYSWSSTPEVQEQQENQTDTSLNCLPVLLPPFSWDGDEEYVKTQEQEKKKTEDNICLPITWKSDAVKDSDEEHTYVTKETRIQAWVKTITNVVTIRPRKQNEAVKIGEETTFVNMNVTEKNDDLEKITTAQTLVSTPSTGWAWLNALYKSGDADAPPAIAKLDHDVDEDEEEEDDEKLKDYRKRPQRTEIEEVEADSGTPRLEQPTEIHEEVKDKGVPYDSLRQPLLEEITTELDVEALLSAIVEQKPGNLPALPSSTTVSVKGPDSVVQVTGGDTKQAVETALGIAELLPETRQRQPDLVQEYVKSIVYGGLDVTLTSLAVVSSGAGAGTKTINVVAISLANLVAGLITLFHTIGSLYQTNRPGFEQYIGQSLWLNGGIAVISFLVFGFVAPLTYALSFRATDEHDYKFAATAAASLACICLMGLGKAYVEGKRYVSTVVNLALTGFVASVAGYFVGDYVSRWLQKMGFDTDQLPVPSPPRPPAPALASYGGRRGKASM